MPDIGDAIHRALTEPAADDTVVDPNLADLVRSAWRRRQGSPRRYSELGSQLPALIRGVQQAQLSATHELTAGVRRSAHCAADLYALVRTVAKRVGRVDLALLAVDRGLVAARVAGDPVRLAAARWNLAHVLLAQGQPASAEAVAEALAPRIGDDLDALAVQGALRLLTAMASVRQGAVWKARDRVRSAAPTAERTGERNVCWTAFGPTNVAMHAVSVEVEAGDTGEALRLAERIEPDRTPSIERRPAARAALKIVIQRARGGVAQQAPRLATDARVSVA